MVSLPRSQPSALSSIIRQLCPRCRTGRIFRSTIYWGFPRIAFGAVLWVLTHWRVDKVAIWAVLGFLPFAPMLTFLSRVLWIYLDQTIDPEIK